MNHLKIKILILLIFIIASQNAVSQDDKKVNRSGKFRIARLKFSGGGDWYNDPSEQVNMMEYLRKNTTIDVDKPEFYVVDVASDDIFDFPFVIITCHGNIDFSASEVERLRKYCGSGGFIYADDDYGMDKAFRREIKKVFPELNLVELPFSYGLYTCHFNFPNGVPKTHKHDGKPPQGFGLFHNGRLVVYYTYESNPSDGWADPEIHGDPEPVRQEALRFGTNIVVWALTH